MAFRYAILGAGRQGTAAAYDLALRGDASQVILADQNPEAARKAAERVNKLLGRQLATSVAVDVTDSASVLAVLKGVDGVLSAVPYYYNLELANLAIQARTHMVDLGGNTDIVQQQHALDQAARAAGISIIPDCGQVPGMGTSLMLYTMSLLDKATDVYMWDGGLPQKPSPPFNYMLTFHIAGLTNEYAEPALFLRDWKVTAVESMTELEQVEFPSPIGTLEAFVTGGGTSTMPFAFQGKLRTLQNLTLRWPGHYQQLRAYRDLGLWSQEPLNLPGRTVVPRDVFHALFEPKVTFANEKDLVLIRIKVLGEKDGAPAQATLDLVDFFDETTGFTAMERTTGWDAAIVLAMAARGQIPHGAGGVETFVSPGLFLEELHQRGFQITQWVEQI
jgi:lysine 6-dehydrogenase